MITGHTVQMGVSCAYLLASEGGMVLVDAGAPHSERRILRQMQALGRDDLKLIVITHAHLDHYGSAAAVRRVTGAPIAIHRADAEAMARGEMWLGSARGRGVVGYVVLQLVGRTMRSEAASADVLLDDGDSLERYGLDAQVVHTPGHTPGSCCLLVERRLLFAGDLLSTSGRPSAQRYYAHDWSLIPASVRRVQALRPEWVYPGHGRHPMSGETLQAL